MKTVYVQQALGTAFQSSPHEDLQITDDRNERRGFVSEEHAESAKKRLQEQLPEHLWRVIPVEGMEDCFTVEGTMKD
jgi:hypothetical protein